MASLQLYASLLGIAVFIFGSLRIFIRSDLTEGGKRIFSADAKPGTGTSILLRALADPANRIDFAIVGVGFVLMAIFSASISIGA